MKLANGGNGRDSSTERKKDKKMGRMARGNKCDKSVKLDCRAVNIVGIRRPASHKHACRIRAKKITAIEKPTIFGQYCSRSLLAAALTDIEMLLL